MKTRTKMKIDPAAIYIAWQGVSWDTYSVGAGTRLRGSHPLVQHLGAEGFVLDGTPPHEWPSAFDEAVAAAEATAAQAIKPDVPPRIDPATPLADLMVCTQGIIESDAGACGEGRIVTRTDPIVGVAPDCFRPLVEMLGS